MRIGHLLVVALVFTLLGATPALADDLSTYLDRSTQADFQAEQVVTCSTPDGIRDAVVEVSQSGGSLVVQSPVAGADAVRAGAGTLAVASPDGSVRATEVDPTSPLPAATLYTASPKGQVRYLGRDASVVSVLRQDVLRAQMTFDADTGALLRTRVLNPDGSVYCDTRLVSFVPGVPGPAGPQAQASSTDTRHLAHTDQFDSRAMPDDLAGFRRLDQYDYGEGSVLGYYSDGYFSFTLLHSRRRIQLTGVDDAVAVSAPGGSYQRLYGAGTVLYLWESPLGSLALFGDLPPDLQASVLTGLPQPGSPAFFVRWWRRLFG